MANNDVRDAANQNQARARRPFFGISKAWQASVETGGGFIPTVLIGWSLELAYGLAIAGWSGGLRIFCILWFASGAAFCVGMIGGFLFGIPKARSRPQTFDSTEQPSAGAPTPDLAAYHDNTNLEEVSDWLTKIIIGLGLVEIRAIAAAVNDAGIAVGQAIDPAQQFGGIAIATGSLIVGFATGFLYYYLWARVYLMRLLSRFGDKGSASSAKLSQPPARENP